jgi:hypothetical protein
LPNRFWRKVHQTGVEHQMIEQDEVAERRQLTYRSSK